MPTSLSQDHWTRLQALFVADANHSMIDHFQTSPTPLSVMVKQGLKRIVAATPFGRSHSKLTPYLGFLTDVIHQHPDVTLTELKWVLAERHGISVSTRCIDRALTQLGFGYQERARLLISARAC
ncbi:MAG: hypothetical protein AAFQ09_04550 [Pseudomonadota bacterium]